MLQLLSSPDKALAKTNIALYKSGMLDAAIKGINTTFMLVTAITVLALVISFFLKDKKLAKDNSKEQVA